MAATVILVNGASSAGKSTLCKALQARMREPFWHYSIDHFRAGVLPWERIRAGEFTWPSLRPAFFDGFHRCLPALASAGNNLIVDHIIENDAWLADLVRLLAPFDVFFVGVHCPLTELEARERRRGDRRLGEARNDFGTVHDNRIYDCEVDGTQDVGANADAVIAAWRGRQPPGAFARLRIGAFEPACRR
ncbi:MAG TPA: chloramphenicol phosphotransferase [Casimicrobiaceae bacterium]|nr:chloramphenicol phosphotransferase [Casimicrobiaceae bacterium]